MANSPNEIDGAYTAAEVLAMESWVDPKAKTLTGGQDIILTEGGWAVKYDDGTAEILDAVPGNRIAAACTGVDPVAAVGTWSAPDNSDITQLDSQLTFTATFTKSADGASPLDLTLTNTSTVAGASDVIYTWTITHPEDGTMTIGDNDYDSAGDYTYETTDKTAFVAVLTGAGEWTVTLEADRAYGDSSTSATATVTVS